MHPRRALWLLGGLTLLLLLAALCVGSASLWQLFADPQRRDIAWLILGELRLPRALLGLLVGAALGASGAALQGLLRNPLADAGVMGISAWAALGAVLCLYTGLAAQFAMALPLGGLLGAGVGVFLLLLLGGRDSHLGTLILAGIALAALASAMTALALNFAPNPYAALEIVYWLLGSLAGRSWVDLLLAAPLIITGVALLLLCARGLAALSLGELAAASLGVPVQRLRLQVVLGTALAVGAATAVSGAIGFVGLVVPHLLRRHFQHRPGPLILASALGGAALVLAADILVRILPTDMEVKIGVVTALVGAPFFLQLLLRERKRQLA